MQSIELELDMNELQSAEDFLDYFSIDYDQTVVHVNRLHILQRYHDYIEKEKNTLDDDLTYSTYKKLLQAAYNDFINSNALTEKVFKVFHMHEPQHTFVPLTALKVSGV